MSPRTWNKDRAAKRIDKKIAQLPLNDIEIKDYVRDTDLSNLPSHVAYRLDGVHLYADILNLTDMLHVTELEGETCHRRTLRFLNLHYRAVHRMTDMRFDRMARAAANCNSPPSCSPPDTASLTLVLDSMCDDDDCNA
jgi:hypothetical protein